MGLGGKLAGALAEIMVIPTSEISKAAIYHTYGHALWIFAGISLAAFIL